MGDISIKIPVNFFKWMWILRSQSTECSSCYKIYTCTYSINFSGLACQLEMKFQFGIVFISLSWPFLKLQLKMTVGLVCNLNSSSLLGDASFSFHALKPDSVYFHNQHPKILKKITRDCQLITWANLLTVKLFLLPLACKKSRNIIAGSVDRKGRASYKLFKL